MRIFQELVFSCSKYTWATSSVTDDFTTACDTQFSHFHHSWKSHWHTRIILVTVTPTVSKNSARCNLDCKIHRYNKYSWANWGSDKMLSPAWIFHFWWWSHELKSLNKSILMKIKNRGRLCYLWGQKAQDTSFCLDQVLWLLVLFPQLPDEVERDKLWASLKKMNQRNRSWRRQYPLRKLVLPGL